MWGEKTWLWSILLDVKTGAQMLAAVILKPVGGGYQSPGPDKQVSIRQVHCSATLANIHLPKFHYCLITDCSSGMRTQRGIIKRSFSGRSCRGLAFILAAATQLKKKKKGAQHIMKTRSAHLEQILVWRSFNMCWCLNLFSIDGRTINLKWTGPDDGENIHPKNNLNETFCTFILLWWFKWVWQPVSSQPLNREVRNQSPQPQVLTSFHSRVWSINNARVSAAWATPSSSRAGPVP